LAFGKGGGAPGVYLYCGGFVRDLILHRSSTDFDIVVEGNAINFAKSLSRVLGGKLVIHSAFGTAVWIIHSILGKLLAELGLNELQDIQNLPVHVDFITARDEIYAHPAALPAVLPGSIESDLRRRDFTINTLAINLKAHHFGEIVDLFHGLDDIQHKQIRILHDQSFIDDPTRQLRAIRFERRFDFPIEDHTLTLMQEARTFLRTITGIRLRHEMDLILKEKHFHKMLARAQDLRLLSAIHPSLSWDGHLATAFHEIDLFNWDKEWGIRPSFGRMDFKTGMKYCLWLSTFAIEIQRSLAQRLSIPQAILGAAGRTSRLKAILPRLHGKSVSQITFQLDEFPPIVILANFFSENDHWARHTLKQYLYEWHKIVSFSTGHDLRKLGVPAGPVYKEILRTLRVAWLDGQIHSRDEEQNLLLKMLNQKGDLFKN
jgi:tRNA nucleotidyltransferase (CCA-adding enzyme)